MYERIHSAERSFWLGFSSFLYLSCRLKKHLLVRLSDLSVFDMNKVTTCITLLATEAFFCNKNPDLIGLFLPELTPSVHHTFSTQKLKKKQEVNHQVLAKTSTNISTNIQQKAWDCFSFKRPNTECLDACLLGGGGGFFEQFRDWSLVSWRCLNACATNFCMVPGMMISWRWLLNNFVMVNHGGFGEWVYDLPSQQRLPELFRHPTNHWNKDWIHRPEWINVSYYATVSYSPLSYATLSSATLSYATLSCAQLRCSQLL